MGWESGLLELKGVTLRRAWQELTLTEWRRRLNCRSSGLAAAIKLGQGELRPLEHWCELHPDQRKPLLLALAHTASLSGLSLVMSEPMRVPSLVASFLKKENMLLRFE